MTVDMAMSVHVPWRVVMAVAVEIGRNHQKMLYYNIMGVHLQSFRECLSLKSRGAATSPVSLNNPPSNPAFC